jgi:L-ribulokinase
MQIYADVTGRPMKVSRSAQTCALGAAIFGAVAGGAHASVPDAQKAMCGVKPLVFRPVPEHVGTYEKLYRIYSLLHDAFGVKGSRVALDSVMKELIAIRQSARAGRN